MKNHRLRRWMVIMGCHIRYAVPESLRETLPYEDNAAALVITADAVLYNREELFGLLSTANEKRDIPDSLLILEAYKQWGLKCPEKLVGDFAFVIWDKQKNELFCARDHTGNRTLYYYHTPEIFAFSTLMEPLFKIQAVKRALNDTYIADFLAIPSVITELGDEMTIYENILNLPPATAMIVGKSGMKKWRYWEIKKTKKLRLATDAEYEAAFLKVYSEAVRCRLRCMGKVGISLSGGLDSGSVACLAAPELKKRGETLFSFTQVPMENYKDWLPQSRLADESAYVEEVCAFTGNIESHRVASEGKNPLTEIDEILGIKEQPYKNLGNSHWVNEIRREAARMGAGVLLSGQVGNATVSWGNFDLYSMYLLKSFRLRVLAREINARCAVTHDKPARYIRNAIRVFIPGWVKQYRHRKMNRRDPFQLLSPVNPAFAERMGAGERQKMYGETPVYLVSGNPAAYRKMLLTTAKFSHNGASGTKMSLAFGIEMRDPTKDKRLIEFCFSLPENQWVRNGEDRRLIRRAMAGIMPDKVRLNATIRGKQAADWMQRISPEEWAKVYAEMETIGNGGLERKYLDIPKIKRLLAKNKTLSPDDHDGMGSGVKLLIRAMIFTRFLRSIENKLG